MSRLVSGTVVRAQFSSTQQGHVDLDQDPIAGAAWANGQFAKGKIEFNQEYDARTVPTTAEQRYIRDGLAVHYYHIDPSVAYRHITQKQYTDLLTALVNLAAGGATDVALQDLVRTTLDALEINYRQAEGIYTGTRTVYLIAPIVHIKLRTPATPGFNRDGERQVDMEANAGLRGVLTVEIKGNVANDDYVPGAGRAGNRLWLDGVAGRELFRKYSWVDNERFQSTLYKKEIGDEAGGIAALAAAPGNAFASTNIACTTGFAQDATGVNRVIIVHEGPGIIGGSWPFAVRNTANPGVLPKVPVVDFAPFKLTGGSRPNETVTRENAAKEMETVDTLAKKLANSGRRNIVGVAMSRLEPGRQGDIMLYDGI